MSVERFRDYDPFAWIYNESWGAEFHSQVMGVLDQILLREFPPPAHILDLCCGAGHVTQFLTQRHYRVTGIDGSEEMLRYARQKAPEADLRIADARDFTLAAPADAVISTFDSLNHIMTPDDLRRVFVQTYAALRPGGRFVFDLNREEAYRLLWVQTGSTVEDDKVFIARGSYQADARIASCAVTVFRLENGWQRSDFTLRQKFHPEEEVIEGLREVGFVSVRALDAEALGMRGNIGYGRTYFVADRPEF